LIITHDPNLYEHTNFSIDFVLTRDNAFGLVFFWQIAWIASSFFFLNKRGYLALDFKHKNIFSCLLVIMVSHVPKVSQQFNNLSPNHQSNGEPILLTVRMGYSVIDHFGNGEVTSLENNYHREMHVYLKRANEMMPWFCLVQIYRSCNYKTCRDYGLMVPQIWAQQIWLFCSYPFSFL